MRAGQSGVLTQKVDEQKPRLNRATPLHPVDIDFDVFRHKIPADIAGLGRKFEAAHDNKRVGRITRSHGIIRWKVCAPATSGRGALYLRNHGYRLAQQHGFRKEFVEAQILPITQVSIDWNQVVELLTLHVAVEVQHTANRILL